MANQNVRNAGGYEDSPQGFSRLQNDIFEGGINLTNEQENNTNAWQLARNQRSVIAQAAQKNDNEYTLTAGLADPNGTANASFSADNQSYTNGQPDVDMIRRFSPKNAVQRIKQRTVREAQGDQNGRLWQYLGQFSYNQMRRVGQDDIPNVDDLRQALIQQQSQTTLTPGAQALYDNLVGGGTSNNSGSNSGSGQILDQYGNPIRGGGSA
jgi:hypothetical protein